MTSLSTGHEQALFRAAARATLAPSIHNTQPWRFVVAGGGVELHLDRERLLRITDPSSREAVISCGAALFHLRTALATAQLKTTTAILPEPSRPDLLARVRVAGSLLSPDPEAVRLDAGALHRSTNRRGFDPDPLPEEAVAALVTAAESEGVRLQALSSAYETAVLGWLTRAARDAQESSASYRHELAAWTNVPESATAGVPSSALPEAGERASSGIVNRTFESEGPGGALPTVSESGGTLFALVSDDDTPADWLAAGQALARVLLELTVLGYVAHPMSQPVEVASVRQQLRERLSLTGEPQLLLRVGRAAPTGRTPRRTLDATIDRLAEHDATIDGPDIERP